MTLLASSVATEASEAEAVIEKACRHQIRSRWTVVAVSVVTAVVVAATLASCAATTTATRSPPKADLAAASRALVPVVLGDAEISVPSNWYESYLFSCFLPGGSGYMPCQVSWAVSLGSSPNAGTWSVYVKPFPSIAASLGPTKGTRAKVNGIVVFRARSDAGWTYTVPALHVQLTFDGANAEKLLKTLTFSPLAAVLSAGPPTLTPSSWRWHWFAGIRLAVPPSWRQAVNDKFGSDCRGLPLAGAANNVILSTDTDESLFSCSVTGTWRIKAPADEVRVDADAAEAQLAESAVSMPCLAVHALKLCPYQQPGLDLLYVKVSGRALAHPLLLQLGLAGPGRAARAILDSIAPAAPTGESAVVVPDLVGASEQTASRTLRSVGLFPDEVTVASRRQAYDVVSQAPTPHARVARGDIVTLGISSGSPVLAESVLVPGPAGWTKVPWFQVGGDCLQQTGIHLHASGWIMSLTGGWRKSRNPPPQGFPAIPSVGVCLSLYRSAAAAARVQSKLAALVNSLLNPKLPQPSDLWEDPVAVPGVPGAVGDIVSNGTNGEAIYFSRGSVIVGVESLCEAGSSCGVAVSMARHQYLKLPA